MNKFENTYIVKNYFHPTEQDRVELLDFLGERDYKIYLKRIEEYGRINKGDTREHGDIQVS